MGRPSQAPNRLCEPPSPAALSFFCGSFFSGLAFPALPTFSTVSSAASASSAGPGSAVVASVTSLPRRSSRVSGLPTPALPERRVHGGREGVATVGVTRELVERCARRGQQDGVTRLRDGTSRGNRRGHDRRAQIAARLFHFRHICPMNHSSRIHTSILACHNVQ